MQRIFVTGAALVLATIPGSGLAQDATVSIEADHPGATSSRARAGDI